MLMGAGLKRAGGRQKKINKLSDFADQIPTPKTSKGAAGVEIRAPHYYVRALAVAAVQPINSGLQIIGSRHHARLCRVLSGSH